MIWDDTTNASTDVLTALQSRMNSNGWGGTSVCVFSSSLYVLIGTTWTAQTTNEYKYITGFCDQYHVRLWKLSADRVIGAAHKEHWHGFDVFDIEHIGGMGATENDVTPYVVDSFELGETEAKNAFSGSSCWSTSANSHNLNNAYTRKYWTNSGTLHISASSNAYATQINQLC